MSAREVAARDLASCSIRTPAGSSLESAHQTAAALSIPPAERYTTRPRTPAPRTKPGFSARLEKETAPGTVLVRCQSSSAAPPTVLLRLKIRREMSPSADCRHRLPRPRCRSPHTAPDRAESAHR